MVDGGNFDINKALSSMKSHKPQETHHETSDKNFKDELDEIMKLLDGTELFNDK